MKTSLFVLGLGLLSLTSCYTTQTASRSTTSDDDIYYTKKSVDANASNTRRLTYQRSNINTDQSQLPAQSNSSQGNSRFYYDNSAKSNQSQGSYQDSLRNDSLNYVANQNNQNNSTYDDYDYSYATRINHFYYPGYYGFGYYDPFFSPYYYGSPWLGFGLNLGWGWGSYWGSSYYPFWAYGGYGGWGYGAWGYGGYGGYGAYGGAYYRHNYYNNYSGNNIGGNPYAPRRTYGGNANFGISQNSSNGLAANRMVAIANNQRSAFSGSNAFSNPSIARGTFNAPNRASFSSNNGINRPMVNSPMINRNNAFRNPIVSNPGNSLSRNPGNMPVAAPINRANSGARSSYFNNNQRFGGFNPNNNINRSYSPPASSNRSFVAPQRSFSAPQRSFSAPSSSRSFGGGGGGGFGGGGGSRGGRR